MRSRCPAFATIHWVSPNTGAKGSKDTKKRKKSGYILREARKRQKVDVVSGINRGIESYLS